MVYDEFGRPISRKFIHTTVSPIFDDPRIQTFLRGHDGTIFHRPTPVPSDFVQEFYSDIYGNPGFSDDHIQSTTSKPIRKKTSWGRPHVSSNHGHQVKVTSRPTVVAVTTTNRPHRVHHHQDHHHQDDFVDSTHFLVPSQDNHHFR